MDSRDPNDRAVSFIIPALNAESTLGLALDAIERARCDTSKEVLLIDNGSTDETVEVARRRGATVISAPGLTVAALRNLGARLARGGTLAFVDSDCVIAPDWLEKSRPHFGDPAVGAVGSPTHVPLGATWVQRAWALHRHRRSRLGSVQWLPTENLLVRKTAWQEVGGFNEALATCEDVDFCYRLGTRHKILNDPAVHSIHLGEAPSLLVFFRKEVWRGGGNLAGFFSHDFRISELPSLLLPLYHLGALLALVGALVYWVATARPVAFLAAAVVLVTPSLMLALSTAVLMRRIQSLPGLIPVYLTYALARSAAVLPASRSRRETPRRPSADTQHDHPPDDGPDQVHA